MTGDVPLPPVTVEPAPHGCAEADLVVAVGYLPSRCSQSDSPDCAGSSKILAAGAGLGLGARVTERVGFVLRGRLDRQVLVGDGYNPDWFFLVGAGPYLAVDADRRIEGIAGLGVSINGGQALAGIALGMRYTHHLARFFGVAAQGAFVVPRDVSDGVAVEASVALVLQLEDH